MECNTSVVHESRLDTIESPSGPNSRKEDLVMRRSVALLLVVGLSGSTTALGADRSEGKMFATRSVVQCPPNGMVDDVFQ